MLIPTWLRPDFASLLFCPSPTFLHFVVGAGLDGLALKELPALLCTWFNGLAAVLHKVEERTGWPDGLLHAHIALIPPPSSPTSRLREIRLFISFDTGLSNF